MKGILNLTGQNRLVVIRGAQHLLHEPVLLADWPAGDDRRSRLVFVTRGLERSTVERGISAFERAPFLPTARERASITLTASAVPASR